MPTIIVYWSPTRSPQEKEAVADGFVNTLVEKGNARREDVLVVFQNIEDGDAYRGASMPIQTQLSSPNNE
jgi:phenylpyruvate tautomerase PptA (4-oxalocrotonate tautomerase family)